MTDETNAQTDAEQTSAQNDGVIAAANGPQDPLPHSTPPNPVASGEGTAVVPKNSLVGERREKVWQEIAALEAKVAEAYGHMHDEVAEIIARIRGHLTHPNS